MTAKKKPQPHCVNNMDFAKVIGVHFSMASKLKNGHRSPSLDTLIRIWEEFDLPADELLNSAKGGADSFGRYLRDRVFKEELPVSA
jgi:transcriptional regulator with XRE-family HTH domain